MLQEGVGELKDKVPVLLVLNKRDLIKPGEMAKKLEVEVYRPILLHDNLKCPFVLLAKLQYLTMRLLSMLIS